MVIAPTITGIQEIGSIWTSQESPSENHKDRTVPHVGPAVPVPLRQISEQIYGDAGTESTRNAESDGRERIVPETLDDACSESRDCAIADLAAINISRRLRRSPALKSF